MRDVGRHASLPSRMGPSRPQPKTSSALHPGVAPDERRRPDRAKTWGLKHARSGVFLPRRGHRIQPRVSTLGNIQEKQFALKGREITWAKCVRLLPKRKRAFVRQRDNLPLAKIMSTSSKWSDCGPEIDMYFVSVSYTSDLAPFQGASPVWAVPRVETLG